METDPQLSLDAASEAVGRYHPIQAREMLCPPDPLQAVTGVASVLDPCDYRPDLPLVGVSCDSPGASYGPLPSSLQPAGRYRAHSLSASNVLGSFAFMREERALNNFYGSYPKDLGMGHSMSPMSAQGLGAYGFCAGHLGVEKMPPNSSNETPSMFLRGDQNFMSLQPAAGVVPLNPQEGVVHPSRPLPRRSPLGRFQSEALGHSEQIDTKEVAHSVMVELKRYSIPQAIFAQRVLCRSQGTLSDLLRNPKPWAKLKSGRETFRRMWKWLQEPDDQKISSLRLEACRRKEHEQTRANHHRLPKKHRLVFTDVQRRTLLAIFRENPRPNRELQATIAQQLGLEPSTVANFFMNSRRRSLDKWLEEDAQGSAGTPHS
ncbi:one cut domain, family member, like [Pristis pectinata]|uniref:one cut domain, family member, like n=1 Tax=Pristis pectinata TaxID=685728 RepID=UPI00223E204A|nr:one cut domain, family member, like [Pristis pectinata]